MSTTAALVKGHYFRSYSGPLNSRYANCECGHQLEWDTRDVDHARHLLAVAWDRGYEASDYEAYARDQGFTQAIGAQPDEFDGNPYRTARLTTTTEEES